MTIGAIITEIDEILEAVNRRNGGVHTPKARALQRKFSVALSRYFKKLQRSFPYEDLRAASKYVKETKGSDARRIAKKAVDPTVSDMDFIIGNYTDKGFQLGTTQALGQVKPRFGVPDATVADGIKKNGARWVRDYTSQSSRWINEETRKILANTIETGFNQGASPQTLAKMVRDRMGQMADATKGRAMMIARTELASSVSNASLNTYQEMGINGKEWLTASASDCDICHDNEGQGVIPVGEAFASGDMAPPAHPNCECTLSPARLPK